MLFAVEGLDGCGKSSVAEALAKRLGGRVLSFPNGAGYTGEAIRSYLRGEWAVRRHPEEDGYGVDPHLSALVSQSLFLANRMEVMPQLQGAATEASHIVLSRYWQSGWVYGTLDGLSPAWLAEVHKGVAQPQINFLLDVTPETAMKRRAARDGALPPERFERKLEQYQRAAGLYRCLWSAHPDVAWPQIDAERPLDQVIELCWAEVQYRLETETWMQR